MLHWRCGWREQVESWNVGLVEEWLVSGAGEFDKQVHVLRLR
jgi:hypothetical protein